MNETKLVELISNGPIEFKDLEEILQQVNCDGSDRHGHQPASGMSQISEFRLNRDMTKLTVAFESIENKYNMLDFGRVSYLSYNFFIFNPDLRTETACQASVLPAVVSNIQPAESPEIIRPRFVVVDSEEEECVGKFMAILNKLTEANFDKMAVQVSALSISSERLLQRVVDSLFKKITTERSFVRLYVSLCKSMWQMKVPSDSNPNQFKHFRQLFLLKCQSEFAKSYFNDPDYLELIEEVDSCEDANRKKQLKMKADEILEFNKSCYLTNMILIGELYKVGFLTEEIVFNCMQALSKYENFDQFRWECLFTLLRVVGSAIDNRKNRAKLNKVFENLETLIDTGKSLGIPNKIRFMIMDIVDLRKNNWKTREELRKSS